MSTSFKVGLVVEIGGGRNGDGENVETCVGCFQEEESRKEGFEGLVINKLFFMLEETWTNFYLEKYYSNTCTAKTNSRV